MCFKNNFLWIRFMKTLIRCALQYVADKYVHNKKSERVNLWDFLIIGGKLWEKSTFNVPQKSPTFVGLFRYFAWVWATPPHDAHAWVHLYIQSTDFTLKRLWWASQNTTWALSVFLVEILLFCAAGEIFNETSTINCAKSTSFSGTSSHSNCLKLCDSA